MPLRTIIACCSAGLLLISPALARSASGLHWERLHVYHSEPSEVFARLGLTHITRYGHTLGQKREPDPTFPPGLTDVVPYDPGHTLLVRGTAAGVAQFRQRVSAADVAEPQWRVSLSLLRPDPDGGSGQVLAGQTKTLTADLPLVVAFDDAGKMPQYQITVRVNPDGTLAVTHRTALSLAPATTGTGVFVPAQVWTPAITEDVRLGDTLTFNDLASDRTAARQQIGQSADDTNGDFQVQIQVSSPTAPPSPSAVSPDRVAP